MTVERTWFVRIPSEIESRIKELSARASACVARAAKLDPGDRTEAARFEAIHAVIDQLSVAALNAGAPAVSSPDVGGGASETIVSIDAQMPGDVATWIRSGAIVTRVRVPHESGETPQEGEVGRGPSLPAVRWQARDVREAGRERFDALLSAALDGANPQGAVIRPSDVSNIVLTESLRRAVEVEPGRPPVELPVAYRDGSVGPKFPLRQLKMSDVIPGSDWRTLRFTLMSIRHVDMDTLVDGAWFRNSRVSRPRQAGLTDELAFEISLRQLRDIRAVAPVVLHLYQTGLQPAVMGFYRAVAVYLMAHPRTLAVVPQYYKGDGGYVQGTPWRTA